MLLLLLFGVEVLLLLVNLRNIVGNRNIVTIIKTIGIRVRLLVSCGIVNIILRLWQDCRVDNLWLSGNSFWVRILRVGANVHVVAIVVPLLLQRRPSFLPDQGIIVLVLRIFFEESLGSRTLALVMMSADVATDVLALVEVRIVNSPFLHSWLAHVGAWSHHDSCTTGLIGIVQDVCVRNVLGMNRASSFNHG